MIGWKANFGLGGSDSIVSDLSEITWYDIDRYFTIITEYKTGQINTLTTWQIPRATYFSKEDIIPKLQDILGDDYYRAYSVLRSPPTGGNVDDKVTAFSYYTDIVPSLFLMTPNITQKIYDDYGVDDTRYVINIYVKSLKRLIRVMPTTPNRIQLYSVTDDGSLTRLLNYSGDTFPPGGLNAATGDSFNFLCILNYSNDIELTDISNYTQLYVGWQIIAGTVVPYRMAEVKSSSFPDGAVEFFKLLFQETTVPDIVYGEGDDPYNPGGDSGEGGGEGDFDNTSDEIDFPELPSLSAVDTKFITLFNPSIAELQNLAAYMWSSLFDIAAWKKLFADPMDAILGLSIVPVNVPNGGPGVITVGNISTGVTMNKAASQYVTVDCGSLNVNEYWGAYLDYEPYTKAEIFLPYIGAHSISADDIMNKNVHVKYNVDILTGACVAFVKCGQSVLYSFTGQCSTSIPITGNDWTNVINGYVQALTSVGLVAVSSGSAAPMMAASAIASSASYTVNSMKPTIQRSGNLTGMGGMLGIQKPYLILTRPRQALPANQNSFMGYPSFMTVKLSSCKGFTQISSIHLENIPATPGELNELESILKEGAIF